MKAHVATLFAALFCTVTVGACDESESIDDRDFAISDVDPELEDEAESEGLAGAEDYFDAEPETVATQSACVQNWSGAVTLLGGFTSAGNLRVTVVDGNDSSKVYCNKLHQNETCELMLWNGVSNLQIKGDSNTSQFVYYTRAWNSLQQIYWDVIPKPWSGSTDFNFVAVGNDSSTDLVKVEGDPTIQLLSTTCNPST